MTNDTSDRQFWNTEYNWREDAQENYGLWLAWRRFLIERGHSPQGLRNRVPDDQLKTYIMDFLQEQKLVATKVRKQGD